MPWKQSTLKGFLNLFFYCNTYALLTNPSFMYQKKATSTSDEPLKKNSLLNVLLKQPCTSVSYWSGV